MLGQWVRGSRKRLSRCDQSRTGDLSRHCAGERDRTDCCGSCDPRREQRLRNGARNFDGRARSDDARLVDGGDPGGSGPGTGTESHGVEAGREESDAEALERRGKLRRRHVRRRSGEKNLVTARIRGVGIGLRWEFLDELLDRAGARERTQAEPFPIDFLEISPENYMRRGGRYAAALEWISARYPVVTHGLALSLGGCDPLDTEYMSDLSSMVRRVGSPWHTDHLCFGAADGRVLHDLLPVAFTQANVSRIAERICRAREALGLPLAIENVSYYWHPGRADMGEAEFLARVCESADCGLLLDVNNAYVNATNFGHDIDDWMRVAPLDRVVQIHVAGHQWFSVDEHGVGFPCDPGDGNSMIVDTHGADVTEPVYALLGRVLARTGAVPIVLERDHDVPPLDSLLSEVERIRSVVACSGAREVNRPGRRE